MTVRMNIFVGLLSLCAWLISASTALAVTVGVDNITGSFVENPISIGIDFTGTDFTSNSTHVFSFSDNTWNVTLTIQQTVNIPFSFLGFSDFVQITGSAQRLLGVDNITPIPGHLLPIGAGALAGFSLQNGSSTGSSRSHSIVTFPHLNDPSAPFGSDLIETDFTTQTSLQVNPSVYFDINNWHLHIDATIIPEPSSWLLLGTGLAGLVLWKKRTAFSFWVEQIL